MDTFTDWLTQTHDHPVLISAQAHFKLVSIHPFVDGNGRTARLLMNLLLLQEGYPLTIISNKDRTLYIDAIEQAQETDDLTSFYKITTQAVEHSLDEYLQAISESDMSR